MPQTQEQKILFLIEAQGHTTRGDIEKLLGLKTTQAASILKAMILAGRIERVGGGKYLRYIKK